jgi:hypothetical protein
MSHSLAMLLRFCRVRKLMKGMAVSSAESVSLLVPIHPYQPQPSGTVVLHGLESRGWLCTYALAVDIGRRANARGAIRSPLSQSISAPQAKRWRRPAYSGLAHTSGRTRCNAGY